MVSTSQKIQVLLVPLHAQPQSWTQAAIFHAARAQHHQHPCRINHSQPRHLQRKREMGEELLIRSSLPPVTVKLCKAKLAMLD